MLVKRKSDKKRKYFLKLNTAYGMRHKYKLNRQSQSKFFINFYQRQIKN